MLKASMRLSISDQQQLKLYLAPFRLSTFVTDRRTSTHANRVRSAENEWRFVYKGEANRTGSLRIAE